jgi:hypothetical protein
VLLSRSQWLLVFFLPVAVAALYLPTLRGGFVYDSVGQVVYSGYLHKPSNWADVATLRVLAQDQLDRNRPLLLASLMADAALWGREPFGYRLTSVALHSLNAAMLLVLVLQALALLGVSARAASFAALFGALVFALHPLAVEVVAEPSNREDSLVLLCVLGGLLVILRCANRPPASWLWPNAMLALCALFSVTAKESGVATPFIFSVGAAVFCRPLLRRMLPGILVGLVMVTAFLAASYWWRPVDSVIFTRPPPPLAPDLPTAVSVQSRIWAKQVLQVLWPSGLSAHYPGRAIAGIPLAAALVLLVAAGSVAVLAARTNRLAALGCSVFVLGLIPASNAAAQFHPMADRYLYVPLAGVGMVAAAAGALARSRRRWLRRGSVALAVACVVALGLANIQRQAVWQNPGNLWADVLEKYPEEPIAFLGLGNESYRQGDYEEALRHAAAGVVASRARWDDIVALRAMSEWKTGRRTEAVATFRLLCAQSPDYRNLDELVLELRWSTAQRQTLREIAEAAGR